MSVDLQMSLKYVYLSLKSTLVINEEDMINKNVVIKLDEFLK